MMPGSIATNVHQGYRSEYLAQFAFSAFGTAVSVPAQEDSGLDLNCTLMEAVGRRSWVRQYFHVQVKSSLDPWIFDEPEAVRWLVTHPTPILLCVVKKSDAVIRVFQVNKRFEAWAYGPLPTRLELIPAPRRVTKGDDSRWTSEQPIWLGIPILEFDVADLGNPLLMKQFRATLASWLDVEARNLRNVRQRVHWMDLPSNYKTNQPIDELTPRMGSGAAKVPMENVEAAIAELASALSWIADQHQEHDRLDVAALAAMFLEATCPGSTDAFPVKTGLELQKRLLCSSPHEALKILLDNLRSQLSRQ